MFDAASGLRSRLHARDVTLGTWITLGHPAVGEILAGCGFDWLVVDMEHSAIDLPQAQELIRVISLAGGVPLVRMPDQGPTLIKRVLDAGAAGVVVPDVRSAEQAKGVVASAKYPLAGSRGVGLARAQGYGLGFEAYRDWQAEGVIVIVQIEHIDAVEVIEDILGVDGVDGCIVGPYDMSGSLGVPGELDDARVESAVARVAEAAAKAKVSAGYHVVPLQPEQVTSRIEQGFNFVGYTLDSLVLAQTYRDHVSGIRESLRGGVR